MRTWLKDIRLMKKATQEEIAELSNISRSYYTQIELGLKTPNVDTAKKIAVALGFDWSNFFKD
ncbi:helix-turn-helix transcriptional regulator [Lysinibacillus sp. NPDC059133]|uniref:helix-turn-helix transcriptional regulator n=1 Tax=Lysinibacillus sp. NPDC059133 TaxID=3346737 RepID=UPI0036A253B5